MRTKFFIFVFFGALLYVGVFSAFAQQKPVSACVGGVPSQCNDGKDNQKGNGIDYGFGKGEGDGKADRCGLDQDGDGKIEIEPDPACIVDGATEEFTDKPTGSTIIPCSDKCSFSDVFRLINNIITFFFTTILIPLFIVIIMWLGFKYITSQGTPNARAMVLKTFGNIVKGLVIILVAWLVVRTALGMIVNQEEFGDVFMFFE